MELKIIRVRMGDILFAKQGGLLRRGSGPEYL